MKYALTSIEFSTISPACVAVAMLGAVFAGVGASQSTAPASPSAVQPFTPAQVAGGQASYSANCAGCHGANLTDGSAPSLKDAGFRANWLSKPSSALTAFIRGSMPPNSVGGLTPATYTNIVAYIFSANNADPGGRGGRGGRGSRAFATRPSKLLDALSPVTDETLTHPSDADWLMWRRTYNGWGYSPLSQIDKNNVKDLKSVWTWSLTSGVSETTPLVHDGILFVHNSGDKIQALDGATGDLLWEYVRQLTSEQIAGSGNQLTKRNLAIYGNNIVTATSDTHLIALNQKTGALVWDVQVADWNRGYRFSGGPMVADGKIIQGMAGCRNFQPGGCFITAHDPATGKELWRVHTVAQDGKEGDTWNGVPVEQRFGASAWISGTYDPDRKIIYYGTGNSYGLIPKVYPAKPGLNNDALYTDSTLAIDAGKGVLKWSFQHLQADIWDLDYAYERMLIDLPVNGAVRREVVTAGKTGIIEALDRTNGAWLWYKETAPQNIVLSIDDKTGRKTINPAIMPEPGKTAIAHCPDDPGARGWPATAYDPRSQILYLPLNEFCSGSGSLAPVPNSDGNIGRVDAIKLTDRTTVWSDRQRAPMTSALLPTGGGIVFGGDLDRYFRAYDEQTGKVLWQTRTNSVVNSFPVTYSIDGKQYVAVVVGAGSTLPRVLGDLTREIPSPAAGTVLWVFALPDAAR